MFSPLNDPQVEHWFQRLDAAWRRMPAEEQTRQREEVQQHLEGLVAAKVAQGQSAEDAWKAALVQFGNPSQIGRKIYHEWRQSKTGFRADMGAIAFGFGLQVLLLSVIQLEGHSDLFVSRNISHFSAIGTVIAYVENALVFAAIGRKYPLQAIKGAFYGDLVFALGDWTFLAGTLAFQHLPVQPPLLLEFIGHSLLWLPPWLAGKVAVAYLASVTKRGWYRPTWEDFKLTWPKRRRQVG